MPKYYTPPGTHTLISIIRCRYFNYNVTSFFQRVSCQRYQRILKTAYIWKTNHRFRYAFTEAHWENNWKKKKGKKSFNRSFSKTLISALKTLDTHNICNRSSPLDVRKDSVFTLSSCVFQTWRSFKNIKSNYWISFAFSTGNNWWVCHVVTCWLHPAVFKHLKQGFDISLIFKILNILQVWNTAC